MVSQKNGRPEVTRPPVRTPRAFCRGAVIEIVPGTDQLHLLAEVEKARPESAESWVPWTWVLETWGRYTDEWPIGPLLLDPQNNRMIRVERFRLRPRAPGLTDAGLEGAVLSDGQIVYRPLSRNGRELTARELAQVEQGVALLHWQCRRYDHREPEEVLGYLVDALPRSRAYAKNWRSLSVVLDRGGLTMARAYLWRCLKSYGWTWRTVRDHLAPIDLQKGTKKRGQRPHDG